MIREFTKYFSLNQQEHDMMTTLAAFGDRISTFALGGLIVAVAALGFGAWWLWTHRKRK